MVVLRLWLLGDFRAETGEGTPIVIPSRKGQALLAYLAMTAGQKHSRDKLAALLWSDRPDERARHSLRQCVLMLRKTLGEEAGAALDSEGESLRLDPEAIEVDALTFERLAGARERAGLERAAGLYGGELLEGFNLRSEEFDVWLYAERPRLRHLAVEALGALAELRARAGEGDAAIEAGQHLLTLDPVHEPTHRLLMRVHAESGRRSAALRQYQACEEALRAELDAEPEAETVGLYDQIRTQPRGEAGNGGVSIEPPALAAAAAGGRRIVVPSALAGAAEGTAEGVAAAAKGLGVELISLARSVRGLYRAARAALRGRLAWAVGGAVFAFALTGAGLWYLFGEVIKEQALPLVIEAQNRARLERMPYPLPTQPSIAVLPFENRSDDPEQDDLIDGITEEITSALSIMSEMFVIARASTLRYQDQPLDAQRIAEELSVRYLLLGSVQKSGTQIRVSAQLVDAVDGHQMWAGRYDRELKDVFALQDEITQEIVTALQVQITEGEQERISLQHGTENVEAWMLAGHGLKLLRRLTREDNVRARDLYGQAVVLDPTYAGAWDGLAWTHFLDARFGWSESPEESLRLAATFAEKAIGLDPTRPRTYAILGNLSVMNGEHDKGKALLEKAVSLSPNGADVVALLGLALTYTGDYKRSISLIERAMRLSPYYPSWYRWSLGRAYRLDGQHMRALAWLRHTPEGERPSLIQRLELAATYSELGRLSSARDEARAILRDHPDFSVGAWTRWPPYENPAVAQREAASLIRAGLPQ